MIDVAGAAAVGLLAGFVAVRPRPPRHVVSRVVWRPDRRVVEDMPGPLVYLCRKRGSDEVKVGYSGRTAGVRISEWSTGVAGHVDVEAVFPAPESAERRLHRVLKRQGRHIAKEWFRLAADDPSWRAVVEREAARH